MNMHDLEAFVYGLLAIVHAAMLLILVERRNRANALRPLVFMIAGSLLMASGSLGENLLAEAVGEPLGRLRAGANFIRWAGLALLPSAVLHWVLRLYCHGFTILPRADRRMMVAYLPMLLLPLGIRFDGVALAAGMAHSLWSAWFVGVTGFAGLACWFLRERFEERGQRRFLTLFSAALVLLASCEGLVYGLVADPHRANGGMALITIAAPLAPTAVLAWAVLRFNFMRLVFRRSVLYAVMLLTLALLHNLVLADFWHSLERRYHINFILLEGTVVVLAFLMLPPLRRRGSAALDYLMGESTEGSREEARRVSMNISAVLGEPPGEVLRWFEQALSRVLRVSYVCAWLLDEHGRTLGRSGTTRGLSNEQALTLLDAMGKRSVLYRSELGGALTGSWLDLAESSVALGLHHARVRALFILGPRQANRELSEERINDAILLVEQFGVAVHSGMLQAERLAAERRAWHHEKLSTIGLMTSSIAHEIHNPLSSMKTILTVMAEEQGEDADHAEDLSLVLGEIDRLSATVRGILETVVPADILTARSMPLDTLVQDTLRLMRHHARQHNVRLSADIDDRIVVHHPGRLRGVLFNLILNSINAAHSVGGQVQVSAHQESNMQLINIRDDGPGIAPEKMATLFEPFVQSSRAAGAGLGLYIVRRWLREMGGDIECTASPDAGTHFRLRLPAVEPSSSEA